MNPMFAAIKGTAMKDKKKRAAAGGGGTASVSMATTSSGNFDNAIKLGIRNSADGNAMSFSGGCLLYTSPSPRDGLLSRMPSSA